MTRSIEVPQQHAGCRAKIVSLTFARVGDLGARTSPGAPHRSPVGDRFVDGPNDVTVGILHGRDQLVATRNPDRVIGLCAGFEKLPEPPTVVVDSRCPIGLVMPLRRALGARSTCWPATLNPA